jgi:hypothetical protein
MAADYLRTLFLHPPSPDGFDGGVGSRYQAKREIRSFWYPTWLAQPAALVPGSRLVDAPPTVSRWTRSARWRGLIFFVDFSRSAAKYAEVLACLAGGLIIYTLDAAGGAERGSDP